MNILDRYLFNTVAGSIFAVLLVIIGIDALAMLIDEVGATQNSYGILQVFFYISLKLPASLAEFAGYAALIGVMLGLGILSNSGELTVIRSSGVSLLGIAWMVLKPALVLIVLTSLISEFVAPRLEQKAENQRNVLRGEDNSQSIQESGLWLFDQGTFLHVNAVYPDGRLFGVSRYKIDLPESELVAVQSARAQFDRDHNQWTEVAVRHTRVSPEAVEASIDNQSGWDTNLRPELLNMSVLSATQLSVRELNDFSQYLGQDENRARKYRVEFWRKLLAPLSIASLVFVGMSFVLGSIRQVAIGERIFVGVMVGTLFQLLQDIFGPASVVWGFSAFWGVMIPILITSGIGLALMRYKS
ncbi:MAG: LPS export ABC transporter permease LptG [Porticoccaceae bacterium]